MRMGLGKILLQEPDLLLLDEPTNHLDVEAIEWLEMYLKSLEVPMVIVSHDREFLDQLCTKVVEVERGLVRPPPLAPHPPDGVSPAADARVALPRRPSTRATTATTHARSRR